MTTEPILQQLGEAIAISRSEPEAARAQLAALWATVGEAGDALHRCAIAHAMADVQTSAADELTWDLRALEAGVLLDDARLEQAGMAATVAGLLSSLHLNLADVYRRLGDPAKARHHVAAGNAAIASLVGNGYTDVVQRALSRIQFSLPHDHAHGHEHGPDCDHE